MSGTTLVLLFCERIAQAGRFATRHELPLREQAGVLFGFAVAAVVRSGVPRDQVLAIAVDHVTVALAEMQTGKVLE